MYEGAILAGFGGQGVISAGILLAYAGMLEDKFVTFFPSYGAEMRGGTANCTVVVSTEEVASPIVETPTSIIVMNEPSLAMFEPKLKNGGLLFVNTSLVKSGASRKDVVVCDVPANELAEGVGNIRIANMVMIGAFCKKTGAIQLDSVFKALPKVFPRAKPEMIEMNIEAIKKGASLI